jgi:hypothetical protein
MGRKEPDVLTMTGLQLWGARSTGYEDLWAWNVGGMRMEKYGLCETSREEGAWMLNALWRTKGDFEGVHFAASSAGGEGNEMILRPGSDSSESSVPLGGSGISASSALVLQPQLTPSSTDPDACSINAASSSSPLAMGCSPGLELVLKSKLQQALTAAAAAAVARVAREALAKASGTCRAGRESTAQRVFSQNSSEYAAAAAGVRPERRLSSESCANKHVVVAGGVNELSTEKDVSKSGLLDGCLAYHHSLSPWFFEI